jgi:hypothetical protein
LNEGVNSDSGLTTHIPEEKYWKDFKIDKETMHDILCESRVIKSDEEIDVLRWASRITCEGHI